MSARRPLPLLIALIALLAAPAAARAEFGIQPGSFTTTAREEDGTLDLQASTHPYSYTVSFAMNVDSEGHSQGGEVRDILVDLPPGLIGDPQAVPSCARQEFEGGQPHCSPAAQIGAVRAVIPELGLVAGPLYNVSPPPGAAAQLGFSAVGLNALQNVSVNTEDYGVHVATDSIPEEVTFVEEKVWGVPAVSSHDGERYCRKGLLLAPGCSTDAVARPFLTLPASCSEPLTTTVEVDSKLNPGHYVAASAQSLDSGGNPSALLGCGAVPFSPSILAAPTALSAGSASGLDFTLSLPNEGLLNANPGVRVETEPVRTEVTLPAGVTVNPAAAAGAGICTSAQFQAVKEGAPAGCPPDSKLGTLLARTPLLEEAIEGAVYLGAPHEEPSGSLAIALYIVARVPARGVTVAQAGEVQVDPQSGQLATTFDELPPLPYSSFELDLREGPRAPLITPSLCGRYELTARLYPFSDPGTATARSAPFTIASGAGAGACAPSEAQLPNHPAFEAGTLTPLAGAYSPFTFHLSRADGEQPFGQITASLPLGLTGKLAGVPYCSEAQIAAAAARGKEGEGALEAAAPSCPAASEVGTVDVAAGAGSQPIHVAGAAYLAGPYKGAPLSLAIITPAIAGPFDLGVVVVRTALYVDLQSAQIRAVSDPLPRSLHGIPLAVRSVSLDMDRKDFTLNPTSCAAKTVAGEETSTLGQVAPLSARFQVGGCAGLGFKPRLAISLKGATKRGGHPALRAVVTYPKEGEYANIARAQVGLPHAEFLDQGNLDKVCTQPELKSNTCPASSIYGHAKAWSPLLEAPLEGPVYLGVGFGHKLPDLVADLNGQIRILLHGRVDTTKADGIRNTFEAVPDAPVSRFVLEMKGGKIYGLLENSEDICKKAQRATARFGAQNGRTLQLDPVIANSCKHKKKKK